MIRIRLPQRQFADVMADRVTFQGEDIVMWLQGTEVARHHLGLVEALEIIDVGSTAPTKLARRTRQRPRPIPLLLPRPWKPT